jgi:hypothetical protein
LRRDEPRRRLGWLDRSRRRDAGGYGGRWLRRRNSRTCRRRRCNGTRRRSRLGCALRDRFQHIARLGDMRQVDLRLKLVGPRRRRTRATGRTSAGMLREITLDALRFVHLDRTRVRFLFRNTDLGKNVEDFSALYLEFSRQIIDSNLVLHYAPFPPCCPAWLRLHSILTVVVDIQKGSSVRCAIPILPSIPARRAEALLYICRPQAALFK